ncbi:MAG: 1-acyl-sn-glycerol-3-phosphate acyltransferase [Solirubrobacterales bacterium]
MRGDEPSLAPELRERDPAYVRRWLPYTWRLIATWFRPDIRGIERIPASGPVLLVGNHSGGNVAPDTLAFTLAFYRHFGAGRRFYQLAHHLVMRAPWLAALRRYGTVEATSANAEAALAAGAAVLVYPGGDWEVHRPSWHGHRVEFAGREGFVRLALKTGAPIAPVVSIGGQETALFLTRGEGLARALRLDRRFRLKVLPISIALPWGIDVGDAFGHIALPAKITIEVLEPIDLKQRFGADPDVDAIYDEITGLMQETLDRLAAQRRWPVIG